MFPQKPFNERKKDKVPRMMPLFDIRYSIQSNFAPITTQNKGLTKVT